jgi:hypothetical protein
MIAALIRWSVANRFGAAGDAVCHGMGHLVGSEHAH